MLNLSLGLSRRSSAAAIDLSHLNVGAAVPLFGWDFDKGAGVIPALGENQVTNGTFDTDLTGWTDDSLGSSSVSVSSGKANFVADGASDARIYQTFTATAGSLWRLTFEFEENINSTIIVRAGTTAFASTYHNKSATTAGSEEHYFTVTASGTVFLGFILSTTNGDINLDNVVLQEVSTGAGEQTSDLTKAITVTGGGSRIGIVDGVPTAFGAGEFFFDTMNGKKVLRGDEGAERLTPLDPASYPIIGGTLTDNGSFGVFNDVTLTPSQTHNRLEHIGAKFTSGNSYTTSALVHMDSLTSKAEIQMMSRDGTDNARIVVAIDLTGATPSLGGVGKHGDGADWTDTSVSSTYVGSDRYRIDLSGTCNFTGGSADSISLRYDDLTGTNPIRLSAFQTTKSKSFPGWIGTADNQGDTNVTAPEIQYAPTELVAFAFASLGTRALTAAYKFHAARDLEDQYHLVQLEGNNFHSVRTNNSGVITYQNAQGNRTDAGGALSAGSHTAVVNDGDGVALSADGASVVSIGSGTTDKSGFTSSNIQFLSNAGTGSLDWPGGLEQITFVAADASDADMEAWPS